MSPFIQIRFNRHFAFTVACLLFLCFSGIRTFAQAYYSVNPKYIKSKLEDNNCLNNYKPDYPDTTVSNLHEFFPRNFLGNIGISSPDYILKYHASDAGFRLYPSSLSNDRLSEKQVQYFRTKGPYASVNGIAGSKQLQILKFIFTHTYKDKINVALRFNRYTSKGFYSHQQSYTNNFYLSSNFTSKNERTGYYFYYLNNGNKFQENGGIEGDSLSTEDVSQPKELLGVRLSSALRNNRENQVMFNPWIKLNRSADSLDKLNSYLQLKSSFNSSSFIYKDDNVNKNDFYFLFYHDTVRTYDSTSLQKFANELSYTLLKGKRSKGFSLGYRNELNRLWQKTDSIFMNDIVFVDAQFSKMIKKDSLNKGMLFEDQMKAQYVLNGPNSSNYIAENRSGFTFSGKHQLSLLLNISLESRNPDHFYNYWVSNHYTWFNNGFLPMQTGQIQLGASLDKKIGVELFTKNVTNFLYLDELAYPAQLRGDMLLSGTKAYASVTLFRHLGLRVEHTYQTSSKQNYISLPSNISKAQLYYTGNLFKGNLQLNTGVQAEVYSSFYSYAYMPATQMFYLQNRIMTAQYPYLTVYLNARIRPVSIFVRVENALQNYAGTNYSMVAGYFQPDRCVRFGINWMFFD